MAEYDSDSDPGLAGQAQRGPAQGGSLLAAAARSRLPQAPSGCLLPEHLRRSGSMQMVVSYLERVDQEAAKIAKQRGAIRASTACLQPEV